MKRPVLFLLLLLCMGWSNAQMVTGVWRGSITKGSGLFAKSMKLEVKLVKKGDSLVGTSYYYINSKIYMRYSVRGYFDAASNAVHWEDHAYLLSKPEKTAQSPDVRPDPMKSTADFNCPNPNAVMKLDGISTLGEDQIFDTHLTKVPKSFFPDEWDDVIEGYTAGMADPDVIDSVWAIASVPENPLIAKARKDEEEKAKQQEIAKARAATEEKTRQETIAREKAAAEEKTRLEEVAKAKAIADEIARQDEVAKAKARAEEKVKQEEIAKAKVEAEEKAKQEEIAKAKAVAEEKAKQEEIAKAKVEAEEKAKQEEIAKAKAVAEEKVRQEEIAKAKIEAEEKAKQEEIARARAEVEEKAKQEEIAKAKAVADEKARQEEIARAKLVAEEKAKQDEIAKKAAQEKARQDAIVKAKAVQEKALEEAKAKAKAEQDERARQTAIAKAKQEEEAKAKLAAANPDGSKVAAGTVINNQKPTAKPLTTPEIQDPDAIKKFTTRRKIQQGEIPMVGDSIELHFYDNAEVDGDSISLFVNGRLMFNHVKLTSQPYIFKLPVKDLPDDSEMAMLAENLGAIPPNTALMLAFINGERYSIRLESTESSTGTVKLVRRE